MGLQFSFIGIYILVRSRHSWINIKGYIKAYKSYSQILQRVNEQYPNATQDELILSPRKKKEEKYDDDEDVKYEICGICRDDMTCAKKLPCSHKFHLRCLMGWMRYKHTCPICRQNLAVVPSVVNAAAVVNNAGVDGAGRQTWPWYLNILSFFIDVEEGGVGRGNRIGIPLLRRARPGNNLSTEEQIIRISEVFGGRLGDDQIRMRLLRTHSMQRTIEYFLSHPIPVL